jgi:nicotinamide mononucleotide transporter
MEKIKSWARGEFWDGYTLFEKLFMLGMLLLQIGVFAIAPDSIIGIVSGISGVISVVLCAKGKISFYYIGFIQTFSYLVLAWEARFYGEVIENVFYLVTMVMGIFMWKKHMITNKDGSKQVAAKRFTLKQWITSGIISIIGTIGMGFVLNAIGSAQAYTDAATNVFAIFAQILMIKRFKEQWIWWLLIDLFCIKLWVVAGNWSMVAMYVAWTINCIYGWYTWSKLNKQAELAELEVVEVLT